MTENEFYVFLTDQHGVIDCSNADVDCKVEALDLLESLGYEIGFDKEESIHYRYIYFDDSVDQIHMYGNDYGYKKISVDQFLSIYQQALPDPCSLAELYDWIA